MFAMLNPLQLKMSTWQMKFSVFLINSAVIRGFKEFCCVFSIHFSLCIPLAAKGNTVSSCTSTTHNKLLLLYSFETAKIISDKFIILIWGSFLQKKFKKES